MVSQLAPVEISEVRQTAKLIVNSQDVSISAVETAQDAMDEMMREAADYGITNAEVIAAILGPAFGKRARGCDCHSCRYRREEL